MIALNGLACAYIGLREYRRAVDYYERCLQIAQRIGQRHEEGEAHWGLSKLLDDLGDRPQAIKHAEAALRIKGDSGDKSADEVRAQLAAWGVHFEPQ
jgi:tetratricopeptide (TPR) repeat protein